MMDILLKLLGLRDFSVFFPTWTNRLDDFFIDWIVT